MKMISWNIQWGRNAAGVVDLARTLSEARQIADFDLLTLQEVTRGFHSLPGGPGDDQFAELAAALPGFTVLEAIGADLPPLEAGGQRRQFGNALATRFPVEQVIRHALPWPADPGAPSMQRVALEAVLRTSSGPLRVIVTHLEYYSLKQRLAQVDALRQLQLEAADHAAHPAPAENSAGPFAATVRPISAIVSGDFNSAFGSEAYRRFIAPLEGAPSFIDAWTELHPGQTPPPTAGVFDLDQWSDGPITCDFVFVTEDLRDRLRRCVIDGATQASDHQPILLELA
ncbi:MAG TPA: endonuclease/exonuclease/phosphatase family protein [Trinickia sp.]|jgi:endonuclease/exonuclease/phosphatase family metal-dependent hydrolase|uniref:endonuclease/exonuclease/phosphatase family protein n=1 Tax=Trinickia sp. TaxID=2571163 RepID=UPI002BF4DF17|nr:endonuclease/exonuclease/phosphatase family protein [Trinickia sp.]HTI16212.1 endonuclease/exonuclease/phosphatase family protein [Trinickia sp.]